MQAFLLKSQLLMMKSDHPPLALRCQPAYKWHYMLHLYIVNLVYSIHDPTEQAIRKTIESSERMIGQEIVYADSIDFSKN
jgi:hypothetical protein